MPTSQLTTSIPRFVIDETGSLKKGRSRLAYNANIPVRQAVPRTASWECFWPTSPDVGGRWSNGSCTCHRAGATTRPGGPKPRYRRTCGLPPSQRWGCRCCGDRSMPARPMGDRRRGIRQGQQIPALATRTAHALRPGRRVQPEDPDRRRQRPCRRFAAAAPVSAWKRRSSSDLWSLGSS
jgi:hypothetical protein